MSLYFGLIFLFSLLLTSVLTLALIFCIYLYYFASWDIMHYEIDMNNLRVIRLNKRNKYLATVLDVKNSSVGMFKYGSLKEFLGYFDDDSKLNINKILADSYITNVTYKLDVKLNDDIIKKTHFLTWFLFKIEKFIIRKHQTHLTIYATSTNKFLCTLTWSKWFSNKKLFKFDDFKQSEDKLAKWKNFVVVGFLLKTSKYNYPFFNTDLKIILKTVNLKKRYVKVFKDQDIIYLLIKNLSSFKYNSLLKKISYLNNYSNLNDYYYKLTIFRYPLLNTLYYKHNLKEILNYALYNLYITKKPNDYINFKASLLKDEKYLNFTKSLNLYKTLNANSQDFDLFIQEVTNTEYIDEKISLDLVKTDIWHQEISKDQIDFFQAIPYLEYKYQNLWFDYLDNYAKTENKAILVKLSQERFLRTDFLINDTKAICLLYADYDDFSFNRLNTKILLHGKLNFKYGVYLTNITKSTYNLVSALQNLKYIVLSKELCLQLKNWALIFSCFHLVKLAREKNITVIFEQIDPNWETLIFEKLQIEYTLKTFVKLEK
ncbi:MHO_4530 family protein [Mycoplasmopsis bovirhinis]|uniref:Uncharacterized protein n=1 Tax=Mycoplasmopsis bovirhinis TaxID=29553 RepID=A0A449AC72_9BACT|nr:Uncharacterised protein [Mycoplasmopsis bovirhinis]